MFTIALIISLICLAIPVTTWIRMLIHGPRLRSQIRSGMQEVRCEYYARHARTHR